MFRHSRIRRIASLVICFALVLPMFTSIAAAQTSVGATHIDQPQGNPVVNLEAPYVHQLWDTGDSFDGRWACGPTSAVMALAAYRKLSPTDPPLSTSKPYVHTNAYGKYVFSTYTYGSHTFSQTRYDASGHSASGAYGSSLTPEGAAYYGYIKQYLEKHDIDTELIDPAHFAADSLDKIKQFLNQGHLVILSTGLTSGSGHIILVKGYTDDNRLIVHDPYGNKFGANGYGKYDGANVQYTWQQLYAYSSAPKWMIAVKGVIDTDDNRTLTSSQALSGVISPNNDEDIYTFSGTSGSVIRLTMNKTSGSLDSFLELYGPNGLVTHNDDANGVLNSQIDTTLPADGSYRVVAHSYGRGSSGGYALTLTTQATDGDDFRWLIINNPLHGTLNPNNDRDTYYIWGADNVVLSIRMNRDSVPLDSYLELYSPNGALVALNDDGGGNDNSWLVYRFPTSGQYRLVARSYNARSGGGYTLTANYVRGINYALNKPVTISSLQDSSYTAAYATDGNRNTRWSSGRNLKQWIYVDLGQTVSVSQAVIRWERARATSYGIYYWDGANWVLLRSVSNGAGDVDALSFNTVSTRYVLLGMSGRSSRWGNYSLWEFEVYDSLGTLMPLVPPDGQKDAETDVVPLIPLAPDPEGKDAPILALPSEQEMQPLPDADSAIVTPTVSLSETYGIPTTTLILSEPIIQRGATITATASDAHDTDSSQVGSGIASYRWGFASVLPGETGTVVESLPDQQVVTISAEGRMSGVYILSLEVEDDEGNWSERMTQQITISGDLYLPLITAQ